MAFETAQYKFLYTVLSQDASPMHTSEVESFEEKYRQLQILETQRGICELVSLEKVFRMMQYQAYFASYIKQKKAKSAFYTLSDTNFKMLMKSRNTLITRHKLLYSEEESKKLSASLQILQLLESARTGIWKTLADIRDDLSHATYTTKENGDILPDWY